MKLSKLQALGAALALFVAVYFPAFAAVSLLRPPTPNASFTFNVLLPYASAQTRPGRGPARLLGVWKQNGN
jgi:hypothetical protein